MLRKTDGIKSPPFHGGFREFESRPEYQFQRHTMSTKTCRGCGNDYPLTKEFFYSNGFTPNGTQKWKPTCKPCEAKERKDLIMSYVLEVFPKLECERCGYDKCFAALDFHHVDPSKKEYQVGQFFRSRRSKSVVIKELKKCILLCANCHREEHAK
ncbi:HNH endonuclease [Vibrio phage D239]